MDGQPSKYILVQDDEEPIREVIAHMLVSGGYQCAETETALQTLEVLKTRRDIDLVICGILEWSNEDFKEMCEDFPDTPVVVCTSAKDVNVLLRPLRLGAYDYLLKPFESWQLLCLVARALDHRNLRLENRLLRARIEKAPCSAR